MTWVYHKPLPYACTTARSFTASAMMLAITWFWFWTVESAQLSGNKSQETHMLLSCFVMFCLNIVYYQWLYNDYQRISPKSSVFTSVFPWLQHDPIIAIRPSSSLDPVWHLRRQDGDAIPEDHCAILFFVSASVSVAIGLLSFPWFLSMDVLDNLDMIWLVRRW